MIKNKIKRLNALACIAAFVLLAAALATTAGTFAAYRSSATGTATAQVAKWDFNVEWTSIPKETTEFSDMATGPLACKFEVTSNSEVSTNYFVNVKFTQAPPSHLKMWIGSADDENSAVYGNGAASEFSFGPYTCAIGSSTQSHTLNIYVDNKDADGNTPDFNTFEDVDVTISVTAEQID